MNAEPAKLSMIVNMATQHHMEPGAYFDTIKKTVMPSAATNEEIAAFLMVAQQYRLDPVLREIHAFPKKGGGITPVVSIDGWASLINQHPAMNGMEFDVHENTPKTANPFAITCRLYRKDRDRPIEITEYFMECNRNTEPWKAKPRTMLRHKALIQCARYAFGFAGVNDNDEAERINEMRDVSPAKPMPVDKAVLDRFAEPPAPPVDLQYDPDTGELPEPSAADAYEIGRQARDANRALKALPPEWREPGQEKYADAWQDGWRSRDEEIMVKATEAR